MAEDRWYSIALPILEFVHENGAHLSFVSIGQISAGTGIEPNEVTDEVERLCYAGYLVGPLKKMMSGGDARPWFLENSHLGEKGLRVVGAWPSDDPYQTLIDLLDRQIATTSDPAEKSRLAAFKSSAAEVGKGTLVGILTQLAMGGMPHL